MKTQIKPLSSLCLFKYGGYLFAFIIAMLMWCGNVTAQVRVNLTPLPKHMTEGRGNFVLPQSLKVGVAGLGDDIKHEAQKFAKALNRATPLGVELSTSPKDKSHIRLQNDPSCGSEGYILEIKSSGIKIKASTATGFFYAFQSIKKMLPPNVMAGVRDTAVAEYTLPVVSISDEPRFEYRGFMLDVSRHFFSVGEIKRMLNIMAAYKMNVFHWHLTDDQGWRAEIKKYPRLTTIGSKSQNCRMTDMKDGVYWSNEPYGPHFYSQEEMREVVEYAKELHINVLPEIDMPGHFVAAMASYPEFSCNPRAQHNVLTHQGGVWDDVLNVGNPKAVQFAKDILAELCDIFPYPYIHIGGDECPTSAWEKNTECQALYKRLNLDSYRELQSCFIGDISQFVKTRGKQLFVWNESVTAQGADLDIIKQSGATVMSWNPCQKGARTAAELGLNTIVTEYHSANGGYYINRRQSNDAGEPEGAGAGDDTVEGCYNYVPVPADVPAELQKYYKGIQATFWTEWVSDSEYLEYLAMPRLMAVAEAAWSPQDKKDFESFRQRMKADTKMLDYGGYNYAKHIFK